MPRQNRRAPQVPLRRPTGGAQRREQWRGEDYDVRAVTGAGAGKDYRCPGCDQVVAAGVPHVVVWRADDVGAADRRHWHTGCWAARDTRGPTRR